MKYRVLTPNEIEAYNIGYKNGSRQAIIKVLEFESLEEKKLYRQGYNAGCQDRKRHNVSTNDIESNVSNVSNVDSYDSTIAITNTIVDTNVDNKGGVGEKEKEENKAKAHNMLEIFGNAFKATDAVVGVFNRPDGTTREGIQIKNPRLMAFVRQRFDKQVLNKVSDWAIDHNQRGHTYNATALLKLLCKFQRDAEPTINFNHVQAEYLTFEYKGE